MASLDFLERVDVFKGLDDDQLVAVQGCCAEVEFGRGARIFGAREDANYLWIVMDGEVDLKQKSDSAPLQETTITSLSETFAFGWSSLVPPYKHTLSAFCGSRSCKAVKIENGCLTKLFEKDPKMAYMVISKLISMVGDRFHRLQEEVVKRRGQDIINRW